MMAICILFVAGASAAVLIQYCLDRSSEKAAHQFVKDCHGDLPPPSFFKGKKYTVAFLATLMSYYAAAEQERERKERERKVLEPQEPRPKLGKPINPLNESDCPECANGQAHETCRSGWREVLYEANGVNYEALPQWSSPCPRSECGGNCGACGSDHCGVCGTKHGKSCDLPKHAAFERKFNTVPEGLYPELTKQDALKRLRERVASGELWGVKTFCDDCHNHGYVFDQARVSLMMCSKCDTVKVRHNG